MTLSIGMKCYYAQCHYPQCHFVSVLLSVGLLSVILLSAILLSVIMISVVVLSVVAPILTLKYQTRVKIVLGSNTLAYLSGASVAKKKVL